MEGRFIVRGFLFLSRLLFLIFPFWSEGVGGGRFVDGMITKQYVVLPQSFGYSKSNEELQTIPPSFLLNCSQSYLFFVILLKKSIVNTSNFLKFELKNAGVDANSK